MGNFDEFAKEMKERDLDLTQRGMKILEDAKLFVLNHEENFNMDFWVNELSCGTSLCLGGTIVFLDQVLEEETIKTVAACNILDRIDRIERNAEEVLFGKSSPLSTPLFFTDSWDKDLQDKYDNGNPQERAEAGMEAIDRFIKAFEDVNNVL